METTQITKEIFNGLFSQAYVQEMLNSPICLPGEPNQVPKRDRIRKMEDPITISAGRSELDEDFTQIIPGVSVNNGSRPLFLMRYFPMQLKSSSLNINREFQPLVSKSAEVRFYKNALIDYCGHLIDELVDSGITLGLDTAILTISIIIKDLEVQAAFHLYCDSVRQLTGSSYNADIEREQAVRYSFCEKESWYNGIEILPIPSSFETYFQSIFKKQYHEVAERRKKYILDFVFQRHYPNYWINCLQVPFLHLDSGLDWHMYSYLSNPILDEMKMLGIPVVSKIGNPDILQMTGAYVRLE